MQSSSHVPGGEPLDEPPVLGLLDVVELGAQPPVEGQQVAIDRR
ncbi:hypothetical protein [Saccharopolyspora spinosa]|nr:hypothetical protein [Saccharopolyspora spinosa]